MKGKLCTLCKEREQLPYNSRCRECHNEYQKDYYKRNPRSINKSAIRRRREIRKMVIESKNKSCEDCGIQYHWYVMDLDHVRDKKKFSLSIAGSHMWALKTVQEEIDKCDVVCSNCHRERTFTRQFDQG